MISFTKIKNSEGFKRIIKDAKDIIVWTSFFALGLCALHLISLVT